MGMLFFLFAFRLKNEMTIDTLKIPQKSLILRILQHFKLPNCFLKGMSSTFPLLRKTVFRIYGNDIRKYPCNTFESDVKILKYFRKY